MMRQVGHALVDLAAPAINMTIDEFLNQRVRKQDYLSEQDEAYINVVNQLADILITHGTNEKIVKQVKDINYYVDKYAYPAGLAQRVWAYDDAIEEAVMEYEKNFSIGSK